MKRNIILYSAIAVLFTALGAYFGNLNVQANTTQGQVANELFAVSVPDLNNHAQSLAQWKGKILLVNFWATWCTPCVQEMPELSKMQAENKNPKLQIIGIGVDSAANIQEFSTKLKISYPLYVADTAGSDLLRKFGDSAGGLPFSLLISPDGHVKKTYLGRLDIAQVKQDISLEK
ncbi:MAG TPA: TlpA disulfide reductase family protein [Burkholderiaceae bacterium]|jgi:thiol-disulfide isomerase/thioredoxin|nr:TlpA disulfide reductase family protein [Burkholderiaceae bacterium]